MLKKILFITLSSIFLITQSFALWDVATEAIPLLERMKFLLILVPAAVGDSINPCAFAVMIILLSSILKEHNSMRKAMFAGALFILAIFISYTAMGIWLYSALANTNSTFYLKAVVWTLGVLIWLANLKDYFWYGKWFRMEVPTSWRPNMKKLIKGVVSPLWAFFIGFLISLFLLPCTSGPYITVLWYLASESAQINTWGYIYIVLYNIIFILPMIAIAGIVGMKYSNTAELEEIKELNVEKMHLITGVIMLLLGIYILFDILV